MTDVETFLTVCSPNIAPNNVVDCSVGIGDKFTSTPVKNEAGQPEPLNLEKDQIVQVTVTINFASPAAVPPS